MNKEIIRQLCAQILAAANSIEYRGEGNAVQVVGICRAARQIAAEVNKPEEVLDDGSGA